MRYSLGIRTALVLQLAQDSLYLAVVGVARVRLDDGRSALLYLLEVTLLVVDLNDVVRHNIAVLRRVLDGKKLGESLLIALKLVLREGIVVP